MRDGGHDVASLFMHSLAESWPPLLLLCGWNGSLQVVQNDADTNIEDNGVDNFLSLEHSISCYPMRVLMTDIGGLASWV